MAEKLNINFVREYLEKEGYKLVSTEYINSSTKLECICPNEHTCKLSWSKFRVGRRCKKCSIEKRADKQRKTIEEVRKTFSGRGYTLLSEEYKSNKQKLDYICPEGHLGSISFADFHSCGKGCNICGKRSSSVKQRLDYEEVCRRFSERGYKLLTPHYENARQKLECQCPNGHIWKVSLNVFSRDAECLICYRERLKLPTDRILQIFDGAGLLFIDNKYMGVNKDHWCKCKKGHVIKMSVRSIKRGKSCPKCKEEEYRNKIESYMNKRGYSVISDGKIRSLEKVKCVCPNGHEWGVLWHNFKKEKRCPICLHERTLSKPEEELYTFVKSVCSDAISGDKSVLYPKELDIYVPSKSLAIEYCGLYWHSELSGNKSRRYHRYKYDRCLSKDIRLITIFEDEYLEKPEIVKSRILNALGKSNKKIYARKCEARKLDKRSSIDFTDKNHIQGSAPSIESFGLFYAGTLVAVLTAGLPARPHARKEGVVELKRFCTKCGYSVVGGFSKLFSIFLDFCKINGYKNIVSYCDMRWANPFRSIYDILGFSLSRESKYTNHYVDKNYIKRVRNQTLSLCGSESYGISEFELRASQGYDRIWDCGHRTYVYKVMEDK